MSSVHPIHYLLYTGLLLVLHPSLFIQSLSKNYLFSSSRFSGKAFAKVRRFFVTSKFFRKFFLKKFFRRFQEGVRLILSRSLAHPQGKILGAASTLSSVAPASLSLSSSAALPLESGCKGTDFFRFRNFYCILFCRIFSGFLPNSLIYFMLYSIFFIIVRKRM